MDMKRLWIVFFLILAPVKIAVGGEGDDRLRVLVWNAWRGGNEVERGPEKVLEVVRDVDPDLVSRLLFGMVNSLVEWHRPGGDVDAGVLAHAVTTLAFDGLRAAPPGSD